MPKSVLTDLITQRGNLIVRNALCTKINKFVRHLCAAHLQNNLREGQEVAIEIDVNLFPYHFSSDVTIQLKTYLQSFFGKYFKVNLAHQSWTQLTLETCSRDLFWYDLLRLRAVGE